VGSRLSQGLGRICLKDYRQTQPRYSGGLSIVELKVSKTAFAIIIFQGLAVSFGGCVWRSDNGDHYFGPALFRFSAADGRAQVGQVVRVGFAAETGDSWGISLGWAERTAIAPEVRTNKPQGRGHGQVRYFTPLSSAEAPQPDQWHFSPLYLRVEHEPNILFLSRTIWGAEFLLGREMNTVTLGIARKTRFLPPGNAFSVVHFESTRPLKARATVWPVIDPRGAVPTDLIEEITK
jgi:hypothetical protein